ncbi:hypothetical protein BN7874_210 [Phage NCTB]|nr:hypothetical protein BN7874_210 [Phage NCTB]
MSTGWLDVGGLISDFSHYDFNRIKVRPLTVGDLSVLDNATRHKSIDTLINLMQDHVDQDVTKLLVLDFKYILHWLRQKSFPENSITITWRCVNPRIHVKDFPKEFVRDAGIAHLNSSSLSRLGYERSPCHRLNTEIVYQVKTRVEQIPDNFKLPKGYKWPLIRDLLEAEDMLEKPENEAIVPYLMWIKADSLSEALEEFDWYNDDATQTMHTIDSLRAMRYGTYTLYKLTCASCGKEYHIDKQADLFEILPAIGTQTVMDLQYNIFGNFPGAVIDEDTPAMKLLYWHSSLVKDKQKKAEEQKQKEATKGGRFG